MTVDNVLKLPSPKEEPDTYKDMMNSLIKDTEQLVFVRVDHDGNLGLGHTNLDFKDLIVMKYYLETYIRALIESPGEDE